MRTALPQRLPFGIWVLALGWLFPASAASPAPNQGRPYIGYAYPAGGQTGTTFEVRLGGQGLDGVHLAFVTGEGVTARVKSYQRALNNQELTLLREQLRELRLDRRKETASDEMLSDLPMMAAEAPGLGDHAEEPGLNSPSTQSLAARIEERLGQSVNRPASVSLANLVTLVMTVAPDAPPGRRELRLATPRGISNPLAFEVGGFPELTRKPMPTSPIQVLGKEAQALRRMSPAEARTHVTLPVTLNGQVGSGEVHRYRLAARRGQQLTLRAQARDLIPFIADAVPGWFQPILAVHDAAGRELAYADDDRFHPDPVLFFEPPADGEYEVAIHDALFRGREDFVYRLSLAETPFVTSIFPLGARLGSPPPVSLHGWNLNGATLEVPRAGAQGIQTLHAHSSQGPSNPLHFAFDTLPETTEREPDSNSGQAQSLSLPVIVNGRIDPAREVDRFQFLGKAHDPVVIEVQARQLGSPLDAFIQLTDSQGRQIAFSDDAEDLTPGLQTHPADPWLMITLPADGAYYVHLSDITGHGGTDYAYRLRISPPRPDFLLCTVPSSLAIPSRGTTTLDVHLFRKDGFDGPVRVALENPPKGIFSDPLTLVGTQAVARLTVRTTLLTTERPLHLSIIGSAQTNGASWSRRAIPAEDRMQAFLWRHLAPATGLPIMVVPPRARNRPQSPVLPPPVTLSTDAAPPPKFTRQQVANRLRQLTGLYEEGLLTDSFYQQKLAECAAAQ